MTFPGKTPFLQVLEIQTHHKEEILDVTNPVQKALGVCQAHEGWVHVYCPHTTAGVAVNEGDDPDVRTDFLTALSDIIRCESKFKHAEGNSKAHVSAVFTGHSQWVPVEGGQLKLGRWQSIWLCEFDGPRKRSLWVSFLGEKGGVEHHA